MALLHSGGFDSHRASPSKNHPGLRNSSAANFAAPALGAGDRQRIAEQYGRLPIHFEANRGQTDSRVKFLARSQGSALFLTQAGAILRLREQAQGDSRATRTGTLQFDLLGASTRAQVSGEEVLPGKSNYLIGTDPSRWHTQIPAFARVKYESVYRGVDLVFHGNARQLEYDFVIAPNANPDAIRLRFRGARKIEKDAEGELRLRVGNSEILEGKPHAYQEVNGTQRDVDAEFEMNPATRQVSFRLGPYDRGKQLVIDPTLEYAADLGGSNFILPPAAIAVDSAGNAYVTGSTASTDFSTTSGALQTAIGDTACETGAERACGDAFVTKLDSTGTVLLYSTYLGGNMQDQGTSIAVDTSGNAYIAGFTASNNFPTTSGGFQTTYGGGNCSTGGTLPCFDAFASVLNFTGSALTYSTYLGGSSDDQASGIALDAAGKIYVTGSAQSSDFPTTPGAFQTTPGADNVFVASLDPAQSGVRSLAYSTFLGALTLGNGIGIGGAIAVDAAGEALITADTTTAGLGTTGAFQAVLPESISPFVAKLNAAGSALIFYTYLGGSGTGLGLIPPAADQPFAIAVDASGNSFVTGIANSTDFPTTPGAFQTTFQVSEGFVTKLNSSGTALVYSTFLGGSAGASGSGIAIDAAGNAYVAGVTTSTDFPLTTVTLEAQPALSFVSQLNAAGNALIFSSYFGGAASTSANAIALDSTGRIYVTGQGSSFSGVPGPGTAGGDFVARINTTALGAAVLLQPSQFTFPNQQVGTSSAPQPFTLTNRGNGPLTISDISQASSPFSETNNCPGSLAAAASCTINVTFSPTDLVTLTGEVLVTDNGVDSPQAISFTGTGGQANAFVTPTSLTFPIQGLNTTSAAQTVTLSNDGSATLTISSIASSGDFAQTNNCGSSLDIGANCAINVTFTPTATGSRSGTLTLTDNSSTGTQTVLLGGTGSSLGFAPTSLTFGSQGISTSSAAQTITVTNDLASAVTFSGASVSGDFAATNNCPASLAPAASCAVSVTFTPTATGARTAMLAVSFGEADSPQMITLSGTGSDFVLASAGDTSVTITPGGHATYSLTLTPTSGFNQAVGFTCSGTPPAGTCSISPSSITLDGTNQEAATVTVQTAQSSLAPPIRTPGNLRPVALFSIGLLLLLMFFKAATPGAFHRMGAKRHGWAPGAVASLVLVISLGLLGACGGGHHVSGGTPTGSYTIRIMGTTGSLSHQVILTLIVK